MLAVVTLREVLTGPLGIAWEPKQACGRRERAGRKNMIRIKQRGAKKKAPARGL